MRRVCCVFHCSSCGSCFSSLTAFDLHRRGAYRDGSRHCVDPDEVKGKTPTSRLTVKTDAGFCDLRWGEPCDSAVIYQSEDAALREPWRPGGREALPTDPVGV